MNTKQIIDLYNSGLSVPKISNLIGENVGSIYNLLNKSGNKLRKGNTKYTIDKNSFKEITPESAYWLGFLVADGHLTNSKKNKNTIVLGLARKDRYHLEKLNKFLKSNKVIYDNTGERNGVVHDQSVLQIHSQSVRENLSKHGFSGKGLNYVAPYYLEKSRDFWRGVIDGDGSLIWYPDRELAILSLCGGFDLLQQYKEFIKQYYPECKANVRQQGNIYIIRSTGKTTVANMIREIYNNSIVSLDRKQKIADEILAYFYIDN